MKVRVTMSSLNDIRINDRSSTETVEDMQRIIREGMVPNYQQLPNCVIVGPGPDECTLSAVRVVDGSEKRVTLIDGQSMYDSVNFGSSNDDIYRMMEMLFRDGYPALSRAMDHTILPPTIEALRAFTGMDRFYLCSSGARAVDTAVDLAFRYWCRIHNKVWTGTDPMWNTTRVISAIGSLHGRSRTSRSLASEASTRTNFGPLMQNVSHVPFDDIDAIESVFREYGNSVVAVVLEPIQGLGGCLVPSPEYLSLVAQLCASNGAVFILDEIRTGFGRTGTDWAFERFGVKPDLLCFGKSAGAGIVPVAGVAGRNDVMTVVEPGGMLFDTWSGVPIQCLALLVAIKYLSDHDLSSRSDRLGNDFFARLQSSYPDVITRVSGLGLFRSISTIFPVEPLRAALLDEGLWTMGLKAIPNTFFLCPPLTISEEMLSQIHAILGRAFARLWKLGAAR